MSETEKFTVDILTAARNKSQTMVAEAERETQKALQDAKSRLAREADDVIRNARAEAEGIKRRHISEARHKVKLQEQVEKDRVLSEVLEETKKKVKEFSDDQNAYHPFLASSISNAIRELGLLEVVVRVNGKDLKRIDRNNLTREIEGKLQKKVKIDWSSEAIEALGGAVVSNVDGSIRIVSTLDQKFEALEPQLFTEAGRLLFGNSA